MKMRSMAGLLLGTAFVVAGCNVNVPAGGGGDAGKPTGNAPAPAPAPAPAAPAAPAPAPAAGGATPSAEVHGLARQNFTVVNNTGHVVVTLNVSASNENSWGPDVLGRDVLANGESAAITFDRGETQCMWDIKATYDDRGTTDMRGVNLCNVATVTLTP